MGIPSFQVGDKPRLEAWRGTNITALASQAAAGATSITVYNPTGYSAGDTIFIAVAEDRMETKVIDTDGVDSDTGVLTLTTALRFGHARETAVWKAKTPTTLNISHQDPSNNEDTLAIGDLTAVSTGYYTYDFALDEAGEWVLRADSDDATTTPDQLVNVQQTEF